MSVMRPPEPGTLIDLDLLEYNLDFDLAELGEDQSECGWPDRVRELITENRDLRRKLDALRALCSAADRYGAPVLSVVGIRTVIGDLP